MNLDDYLPLTMRPGQYGRHSSDILKCINSPPGQNGRHFADDVFKCIFVSEKFYISVKSSLKFVPMGPIDNNGFR